MTDKHGKECGGADGTRIGTPSPSDSLCPSKSTTYSADTVAKGQKQRLTDENTDEKLARSTIHFGDCREVMRGVIDRGERVQMCVTSPPYFGLRDCDQPSEAQ